MAWTAKIVGNGIKEAALIVGVSYTNGSIQFVEQLDMTGGTLDGLSQKIATKLTTLEATQTLLGQVTNGPFIPATATPTTLDDFRTKFRILQNAKTLADLAIITTSDPIYTTALANAKTAFDPSFVTQF